MLKVNFLSYGQYVTDSLTQWDKNQTMEIEGLTLNVIPEIHFTNNEMSRAIVRQATIENGIIKTAIPNSLLQKPLYITAYICIYDEDIFKTVETIVIPIKPRKKPDDYSLENDYEVYSFEKLENRVANAITYEKYNQDLSNLSITFDSKIINSSTELKSEINVERQRITNLSQLEEGSTTGDAELKDVRVGVNSKIYDTAGEAVRGQFDNILSSLGEKREELLGEKEWSNEKFWRKWFAPVEIIKDCFIDSVSFSTQISGTGSADITFAIYDNSRTERLYSDTITINRINADSVYSLEFNLGAFLQKGEYYVYVESLSGSFGYPKVDTPHENSIIKVDTFLSTGRKSYVSATGQGELGTHDTLIFQAEFVFRTLKNNEKISDLENKNVEYDKKIAEYDERISVLEDNLPLASYNMHYIYVSITGNDETGDGTKENPYATILKANDSITGNSPTNRFTIIVGKGIYTDLQEKYSGDTVTGTYKGVVCKNWVFYESEDINKPEECVIEWDGATGFSENISDNLSADMCPFHLTGVNVNKTADWTTHIKGFSFKCKNMRYCLHIEQNGPSDNLIENCIFDWGGIPNVIANQNRPTVGMGGSFFQKTKFINCIFKNEISTAGVQWHDNVYPVSTYGEPLIYKGAEMTFKDCIFDGLDIQMRSTEPDRNMPFVLNVIGCGGLRKVYFSIGGQAAINYWRSNNQGCLIDEDLTANADNNTNSGDLATLKN